MSIQKQGALIAVVIILILLAGLGVYLFAPHEDAVSTSDRDQVSALAGVQVEENMIVISEQGPGNTVIASLVLLTAPGFVAST